jgi:uncharacterized protein
MNFLFLLIAIIAIYFLFAPRLAAWFYRPVLFPRLRMANHDNPPIIEGIAGKPVKFLQANGNSLCGWFYRNANAKFTMLVSHGNFGNMLTHSYLTEALVGGGYSVFIYDYSGYGASTGLPDLTTITNDPEAAYDYLVQSEGLSHENIILYGESIGASIMAYLATVRKARAIICQSGFSSFRSIATEKLCLLKMYPEWLFPRHQLDTVKSLVDVQIPVLVIHGMKDTVVPYHHAQLIFEAASQPKELVAFSDCDHKNVTFANRERFLSDIQKFLVPLCKEKIAEQNIV